MSLICAKKSAITSGTTQYILSEKYPWNEENCNLRSPKGIQKYSLAFEVHFPILRKK